MQFQTEVNHFVPDEGYIRLRQAYAQPTPPPLLHVDLQIHARGRLFEHGRLYTFSQIRD